MTGAWYVYNFECPDARQVRELLSWFDRNHPVDVPDDGAHVLGGLHDDDGKRRPADYAWIANYCYVACPGQNGALVGETAEYWDRLVVAKVDPERETCVEAALLEADEETPEFFGAYHGIDGAAGNALECLFAEQHRFRFRAYAARKPTDDSTPYPAAFTHFFGRFDDPATTLARIHARTDLAVTPETVGLLRNDPAARLDDDARPDPTGSGAGLGPGAAEVDDAELAAAIRRAAGDSEPGDRGDPDGDGREDGSGQEGGSGRTNGDAVPAVAGSGPRAGAGGTPGDGGRAVAGGPPSRGVAVPAGPRWHSGGTPPGEGWSPAELENPWSGRPAGGPADLPPGDRRSSDPADRPWRAGPGEPGGDDSADVPGGTDPYGLDPGGGQSHWSAGGYRRINAFRGGGGGPGSGGSAGYGGPGGGTDPATREQFLNQQLGDDGDEEGATAATAGTEGGTGTGASADPDDGRERSDEESDDGFVDRDTLDAIHQLLISITPGLVLGKVRVKIRDLSRLLQ